MGIATMANSYTLFVTLMGRAERFKARVGEFFVDFDLIVTLTIRSDA